MAPCRSAIRAVATRSRSTRARRSSTAASSPASTACRSASSSTRGERFYDEGEDFWPKRYAIWGGLIAEQPDQIAYSIIDSKAMPQFMPSVFPPVEASSIAELASALGARSGRACRRPSNDTTARCARQVRSRQPRRLPHRGLEPPKSHWARPIETPPFYGYPLRPGITFTYLGVTVDEQARVIMQDERPATNIFAAGEMMAGNILGRGYLAGFGLTIGTVFGRIAGKEAARYAGLDLVKDGERQMTICNACRYCEGYCAVFPAMEQRRRFHQSAI